MKRWAKPSEALFCLRFVVLLLLALGVEAAETPTEYQVAVIVFTQPLDTDEDLTGLPPFAWPDEMREPLPLPENQSTLSAAYEQLRRAPSLRPRLHLAWVQPAESAPYRVRGEGIAGTVRLERDGSLYAGVDIEYRAADGAVYRLHEKRPIRFDEVHYFDHPAFGVLLKVTPKP
ncbi:hypothetical protein JCM13664_21460 [Methylothermus subterraneus]